MGEKRNCREIVAQLAEYYVEEHPKVAGVVYRSMDDKTMLILIFNPNSPTATLLRFTCLGDEELPRAIVDLPALFHMFEALDKGSVRVVVEKLLKGISEVRGASLQASPTGMPFIEMVYEHVGLDDFEDEEELVEKIAGSIPLLAYIVEWIDKAYQQVSKGEPLEDLDPRKILLELWD